jgi:LmbE family N-acetylglucosaminyl deacetylase
LLLTHRPNDYHPDHRYTSQLVQDAAYMVTVPAIVPDTPHLPRNPVIGYMNDAFEKPYSFQPNLIVDVGPVMDKIVSMLDCHVSQFYEWLPFNGGYEQEVPADKEARKRWLAERTQARLRALRDRFRVHAEMACGPHAEFIEAFEACEYGSPWPKWEPAAVNETPSLPQ